MPFFNPGQNTEPGMLTVRVPERVRNKCERVTGPQPERVQSSFAGVNATRTSGTGRERDRNANRNRCEHGLSLWNHFIAPCHSNNFVPIFGSARYIVPSHGKFYSIKLIAVKCAEMFTVSSSRRCTVISSPILPLCQVLGGR